MLRTVLSCAALAFVVLPCTADEPAANPETLIRLTVSPRRPRNRRSATGFCRNWWRCIPAIRFRTI